MGRKFGVKAHARTVRLSRGDFVSPLLRLPVISGDHFGREMHGVAEFGGGPPFTTFMGEHELEDGAENAGLAEEDGLGFVIERDAIEDFGHGHFEHGVDEREQAEKEEVGFAMGNEGREEFAEASANEGGEDEVGGFFLSGSDGGNEADPATDVAFAEHGEGMAHGVNFAFEAEDGGIQIAQQAVADGGFGLDEIFEAGDIELGAGDFREHAEIVEAVGGHVAGVHHFRAAREESLKVDEALVAGADEVTLGLDFFGEHAGAPGAEALDDFGALLFGSELHFYFDDVGDFGERLPGIVGDVVVESDDVSSFFEMAAGGDDVGVGRNGFEDFDNGCGRGQERDEAFDQRVAGAVDEGAASIAQDVEAHQKRAVESGAGGFVGVSVEGVFQAIAKQEFISEDILVAVEDRLACYVA